MPGMAAIVRGAYNAAGITVADSADVTLQVTSDGSLKVASAGAPTSLGNKTMAGSTSVTIASDDTLMSAIKTDVDKIPSKGTASMTGATPVTIAVDDTVLKVGLADKWPVAATPADGEAIGSLSKVRAVLSLLRYGSTTLTDLAKSGATGVITTLVGILNVLPVGKYNATKPSLFDTNGTEFQITARGAVLIAADELTQAQDDTERVIYTSNRAIASATGAWTNYESGTTKIGTTGVNVKATAGRIRRLSGENASATVNYWLVAVNKATAAVANDAVFASTLLPCQLAAAVPSPVIPIDFGPEGVVFATGFSYAISTTPEKVTLAVASDCHVWAQYI